MTPLSLSGCGCNVLVYYINAFIPTAKEERIKAGGDERKKPNIYAEGLFNFSFISPHSSLKLASQLPNFLNLFDSFSPLK
jgi:hypothetical protein